MKKSFIIFLLFFLATLHAQESTLVSAQAAESQGCVEITEINGDYFLDEHQLSSKEFKQILQLNSPDAWKHYRQGVALFSTGWSLLGVGLLGCEVGGIISFCGLTPAMWDGDLNWIWTGLEVFGGGLCFVAAGIPCVVVGKREKNNAYKIYNEECRQKQQSKLELSLQTSPNGIGFALKF